MKVFITVTSNSFYNFLLLLLLNNDSAAWPFIILLILLHIELYEYRKFNMNLSEIDKQNKKKYLQGLLLGN